jgi:predicted O-methyltransferase YrrM
MNAGRLATLPLRYAAAARMAARLHRRPEMQPAEAFAWANGMRWYGDTLEASQADDEISWLLDVLGQEAPRTVVEVGTDQGGTLFLWPYVAADDALIVAIDSRPLGHLGRYSPYAVVRRAFARERQRIELIMPADSQSPDTRSRLAQLLDGRQIDFLFIDADHSYEGVKRDFELYSPLVREGGIVAFHDVAGDAWPGVVRFFSEVSQRYPSERRVGTGERRHGIGLVRLTR